MQNTPSPIQVNVKTPEDTEFDALVYHISHDVRASTRALVDIPQWVHEDIQDAGLALPETISESLDLLVRHSKRLDNMLLDLLTYSRVGRGLNISETDPTLVLSNLLSETESYAEWDIQVDLVPCNIMIGERDIITLFHSIISNAIKHSDGGSRDLKISNTIQNGSVDFLFSDQGPGIEEKYHTKIFDMMTTLKPRDRVEGSGLGLAICKKICEKYGGSIWVKSRPPIRGSQFGIGFPLAN